MPRVNHFENCGIHHQLCLNPKECLLERELDKLCEEKESMRQVLEVAMRRDIELTQRVEELKAENEHYHSREATVCALHRCDPTLIDRASVMLNEYICMVAEPLRREHEGLEDRIEELESALGRIANSDGLEGETGRDYCRGVARSMLERKL